MWGMNAFVLGPTGKRVEPDDKSDLVTIRMSRGTKALKAVSNREDLNQSNTYEEQLVFINGRQFENARG